METPTNTSIEIEHTSGEGVNEEVETHATEEHSGPHVPTIQGEQVWGPVSNVTITTFLFFLLVLGFSFAAKSALNKSKSKLKTGILHAVGFFDKYLISGFQDKVFGRKFFPLIGGMFFIILFGNFFGLIIDWLGVSAPVILKYVRPMHSDLNTTLVLSIITVITFLGISVTYVGGIKTVKSYLFNWKGNNIGEKCISVFIGWLHLIGLPATIASLSLRLFGNIFAGIVLIGVIGYLGAQITSIIPIYGLSEAGLFLTIPFWFFEIFVALVQAIVFAGLMIAYFSQNKHEH